ncbi:MAG: hypothetical protein OEZ38_03065 [Gammaproteobacteria bacterium]|nr:hypothetical protein [Gammaproteobacteria bacterium]
MKRWLVILIPVLFVLVSCSQKSLSLFFDLPSQQPPKQVSQTIAVTNEQPAPAKPQTVTTQPEDEIPLSVVEMESTKTWEEAEKLLPINKLGQPDWALALKNSIIQPRNAIGGKRTPEFVFKFDFYLKGPSPELDAFFPHSTHTQHLDCASCHPKLFRYRGTQITMEDINAGKYCGFCHGTVSFAPGPENCGRCHTALAGE